jgi:hypothetical protein
MRNAVSYSRCKGNIYFLYAKKKAQKIKGNDIAVGPSAVLTALRAGKHVQNRKAKELVRFAEVPPCFGKLTKLILKFNFLLISRAIARLNILSFHRRVNCYIVPLFYFAD